VSLIVYYVLYRLLHGPLNCCQKSDPAIRSGDFDFL